MATLRNTFTALAILAVTLFASALTSHHDTQAPAAPAPSLSQLQSDRVVTSVCNDGARYYVTGRGTPAVQTFVETDATSCP